MFLIPGDSPLGLRLPMDSLPAVPGGGVPVTWPADPWGITDRTAEARIRGASRTCSCAARPKRKKPPERAAQKLGKEPPRTAAGGAPPRGSYLNGNNVRTALTGGIARWLALRVPAAGGARARISSS